MHCTYCGTPIQPQSTTGIHGFQYSDGRIICHRCHLSAVKHDAQLQAISAYVQKCFAKLGLSVSWNTLPVHLKHRSHMQQSSGNMNVVGYATSTMTTWGRRHVKSHITMLYGMPAAWAVETLAHEAAHVWCRTHGVRILTPDAEEGFCNVVACLVLQQLGSRYEAPKRIQALFADPDPVYGEQFRQQWQELQIHGWHTYISHIQTSS